VRGVSQKATVVRDALVAAGYKCATVTGGGTGTFEFEATSGVFTEVQPGSYIFNDTDYAHNLGPDGSLVSSTASSLTSMPSLRGLMYHHFVDVEFLAACFISAVHSHVSPSPNG
jgi:hypothetical protein